MCDLCMLIDYPVAECWRPCYTPHHRQKPRGYIPTTPRGGFDEADFAARQRIADLLAVIRRQRREISELKRRPPTDRATGSAYEGVE